MKQRYSTYKSSGVEWIGEIPSHWRISKYKYISYLYNGDSLNDEQKIKYESDDPNERPYVSSKDIDVDYLTVNYNNGLRIPLSETKFKIGYKGGFLLCIEGGSSGRKMVFLEQDVCFVNKLCYFKSNIENTKFLFYFVRGVKFQSQFKLSLSGLIGGVSISTLKNFEIPLPPLPEQEQIVNYLDEKTSQVDGLISITEKKIELLKQKRTSLINEVVTKGLNKDVELKDSGVEWIGEIPKHWVLKPVKLLCSKEKDSIVDGPFGSSVNVEKDYGDEYEIPVVRTTNITDTGFRVDDLKFMRLEKYNELKRHNVIPGDVLLSKVGTIGNVCLFPKYFSEGILSTTGSCRIRTNSETVNNLFLVYTLLNSKEELKLLSESNVQPFLNMNTVKNIKLPIPPKIEQDNIVNYIIDKTQKLDDLISIEQRRIETLKEYRQSLISEVVTGKIRVCEEVSELQEN